MAKPLILVVCTANACRSRMAESFLEAAAGEGIEVASAGCRPARAVHPGAIETMAELGIELGKRAPQHFSEYADRDVHILITVSASAEKECRQFPVRTKRYHWPFKDPAIVVGTDEMVRGAFRRVRNELSSVFSAYGQGLADASMFKQL